MTVIFGISLLLSTNILFTYDTVPFYLCKDTKTSQQNVTLRRYTNIMDNTFFQSFKDF